MANEFLWIMGAAVADALLGFVGLFSLWLTNNDLDKLSHILMAFAAGSLLGGAFLHLLPESLEELDTHHVLITALAGFILFIFLETYVHWHHCKKCDVHPFSYIMIVGDAIHNFIGGLVLSASFLIDINLGIATLFAIIAHEFPQQLGIFGVLVRGGLSRTKAILYSFLAQSSIILGAFAGYVLSGTIGGMTTFLVPFAAGNFIYIAAADLIPEMHKSDGLSRIKNLVMFFLGLAFMWLLQAH